MSHRPLHEIRRGMIIARIWRKPTRAGVRHTVTVVRLFRNGDEWKESIRFALADIPMLRLALDEAHTWIYRNSQQVRP